jgi:hypothetical protein
VGILFRALVFHLRHADFCALSSWEAAKQQAREVVNQAREEGYLEGFVDVLSMKVAERKAEKEASLARGMQASSTEEGFEKVSLSPWLASCVEIAEAAVCARFSSEFGQELMSHVAQCR